jgi:radical SAM superfamily enzyme YgiQ (UPF0313 family)
VRVLLVSTYDLGRQPFGLASPAAWLRRAGATVECADTSRDPLRDDQIRSAGVIAFYLPMHTATRLAIPLIQRARMTNPEATLVAYGLYAPLNASWLRDSGIAHVLGPEAEADLVEVAGSRIPNSRSPVLSPDSRIPESRVPGPQSRIPRLPFIQPDRSMLVPLDRYAALQMPDGSSRVVGSTEATRGCKHLCRHCPIVPVYRGVFRAIPIDVVLADVRAQVTAGAQHISFGDPDFFNGPRHAQRLVERFAAEFPGLTYDVTIKIEHLLRHADLLPLLRETGCLFVTSAVESIDEEVLRKLQKGHTRSDFREAVTLCRAVGIALAPTFVPFTPWTTLAAYVELLDELEELGLEDAVPPIQLGIRLLVTAQSALLELPDLRARLEPFDAASLTWPWRHGDPRVDALQRDVMAIVASMAASSRSAAFAAIAALARERAGLPARSAPDRSAGCSTASCCHAPAGVPHMTEAWYCCAEPAFAETTAGKPDPSL